MRSYLAIQLFTLSAAIASAERIALPTLPATDFADTEVSTNISITPFIGSRTFSVALSLDATASNNVEVAVGNDAAPVDGVLSPSEESLRFGWDSGLWFLAAPGLTNRIDVAPANKDVRKMLTLKLGIRPNGTLRDIALLDGETPISANPFAMPSALSWNVLRLSVRGVEPTLENLAVRNAPDGTQLIFR